MKDMMMMMMTMIGILSIEIFGNLHSTECKQPTLVRSIRHLVVARENSEQHSTAIYFVAMNVIYDTQLFRSRVIPL